MPPVIPTTMFMLARLVYSEVLLGSVERGQRELVLVDLAQCDREGLVVDGGVDERSDVVEQRSLVQVGVVVVDLTRTLARENHELVLRVDAREQVVDRRVDDAGVLVGHEGLPKCSHPNQGTASNSTTSAAAWPTSRLTTFTSNSSWACISTFAVSSLRACSGASSVPRPTRR